MSKVLTVAIPANNVEKFLKTTLDSFICDKEVMKKIEVIVVDDGSKDSTPDIGREYQEKYPHLKDLRHVVSSDAHELGAISEAENSFLLDDEPYSSKLVTERLFMHLRRTDV